MNRLSKYQLPDGWLEECGLTDPSAPTKQEIEKAWEEINEIAVTFEIIKDLHKALQTLQRDSKTEQERRPFLNKYGPKVARLYAISKDISDSMAEDYEKDTGVLPC